MLKKSPAPAAEKCACETCSGLPDCRRPLLAAVFRHAEGEFVALFVRSPVGLVYLHRCDPPDSVPGSALTRGLEAARAHFGPDDWERSGGRRAALAAHRDAGLKTFA